jgi:hypothetical protein
MYPLLYSQYDRIVSEYYCSAFGYKGDDRENPEVFNKWLSGNLTLLGEKLQGHMLPQNYYVYDENGNRVVTHIVRYENLQPEFDALMERYNLPVRMPAKSAKYVFHFKGKNGNKSGETITINSISPENIERINQIYARDFDFFGYPMISVTPSMSEGQGGKLNANADTDLSGSTGGRTSTIENSSSSSMSSPQIMSQGGNDMMMGQESRGQQSSNRIPQQQMMSLDGNDVIMSNGGQQQQEVTMGQVDSVGGQQLGRSSQQQMVSQDESSSMQADTGDQQRSIVGRMDSGGQQQLDNGGQQQLVQGGGMMSGNAGQQPGMGHEQGMGHDNGNAMSAAGGLPEQPMLGQDGRSMLLPDAGQQRQPMMDQGGNVMATSSSQGQTSSTRSGSLSKGGAALSNGLSLPSEIDGNRLLKPEGLGASGMATSSTSANALQAHNNAAKAATSNLRKGN